MLTYLKIKYSTVILGIIYVLKYLSLKLNVYNFTVS